MHMAWDWDAQPLTPRRPDVWAQSAAASNPRASTYTKTGLPWCIHRLAVFRCVDLLTFEKELPCYVCLLRSQIVL